MHQALIPPLSTEGCSCPLWHYSVTFTNPCRTSCVVLAMASVLTPHELAEECLAGAIGVDVGGVDEVAVGVPVEVVDLPRFVLAGTPSPVLAERHCAERGLGHAQAAVAEKPVPHVQSPWAT